jgi:hypothetical protein
VEEAFKMVEAARAVASEDKQKARLDELHQEMATLFGAVTLKAADAPPARPSVMPVKPPIPGAPPATSPMAPAATAPPPRGPRPAGGLSAAEGP